MAYYPWYVMATLDFGCRMTFSSSIPCKSVSFEGNGGWVAFGDVFKTLTHFLYNGQGGFQA